MSPRDIPAVAERLRRALAEGVPADLPHSRALDISARALGSGSGWHEASARLRGPDRPDPPLLAREIPSNRATGLRAWERPETLRLALGALAETIPAPDGWTPGAWALRARGLWSALLPAIAESASLRGEPMGLPALSEGSSWEGIARLRLDPALSEASRSTLLSWARPWHSAYAPPAPEFLSIREAWAPALEWLARLADRPGDWEADISAGRVFAEKGSDYSAALARALCRSQGLFPRSEPSASRTLRSWFPSSGPLPR